jgi:hypothetical protein
VADKYGVHLWTLPWGKEGGLMDEIRKREAKKRCANKNQIWELKGYEKGW